MAEYIERGALINELSASCIPIDDREMSGLLGCGESIRDIINAVPAADTALKVYAHWEIDEKLSNGYIIYKCSNCGHGISTKATLDEWAYDGGHKYCGSCGVEMCNDRKERKECR